MGLGREHHDVMGASRGEVKLGVVVGDGEDRKKAFSMSRWIRRGNTHTHTHTNHSFTGGLILAYAFHLDIAE